MNNMMKIQLASLFLISANPALALETIELEQASQFNLVVFEDFAPPRYSSFTNAIAVGGDMAVNDYGFAAEVPADSPSISAYIGGDFSYQQGRIFGGSVLVGGTAQGVVQSVRNTLSDDQLIVDDVDVGIDFNAWQMSLQNKALSYSQITPNGQAEFKWGSSYFLTGDCESNLQVFNIDGSFLSQTREFRLECIPEGAALLFNVSGAQTGISYVSTNVFLPFQEKTLFNFYEATQLRFRYTEIHASVLAPFADVVEATGEFYGTAIANSWSGPMTLKWMPFQGYNASIEDCEGPAAN